MLYTSFIMSMFSCLVLCFYFRPTWIGRKIIFLNLNPVIFAEIIDVFVFTALIDKTLSCGESNSLLVLGPRGSGKSALVSSVLSDVSLSDCLLVSLHGLVQTDDRLALKEITKQLKLENVVGDKVIKKGNNRHRS